MKLLNFDDSQLEALKLIKEAEKTFLQHNLKKADVVYVSADLAERFGDPLELFGYELCVDPELAGIACYFRRL